MPGRTTGDETRLRPTGPTLPRKSPTLSHLIATYGYWAVLGLVALERGAQ
jgi:hypothetical protein